MINQKESKKVRIGSWTTIPEMDTDRESGMLC